MVNQLWITNGKNKQQIICTQILPDHAYVEYVIFYRLLEGFRNFKSRGISEIHVTAVINTRVLVIMILIFFNPDNEVNVRGAWQRYIRDDILSTSGG